MMSFLHLWPNARAFAAELATLAVTIAGAATICIYLGAFFGGK